MEVEAEAVDFLKLEVEAEAEAAPNSPLPDTLPTLDAIHLSHIGKFFRLSLKILRLLGLISCTVKPILPCNFSVTYN